jgi:hypothetical protein
VSERDEPEVVRERRNPYAEEYDDWGNSITHLRANLKLTPRQRLERAQASAGSLLELKKRALKKRTP